MHNPPRIVTVSAELATEDGETSASALARAIGDLMFGPSFRSDAGTVRFRAITPPRETWIAVEQDIREALERRKLIVKELTVST